MRKIRVVYFCHERERREKTGYWAYPVPEFSFDRKFKREKPVDVSGLVGAYDILIQSDWGMWDAPTYTGDGIPKAFQAKSCSGKWPVKFNRARKAGRKFDMVLADVVPPRSWDLDVPVVPFNYSINDRLFYDRELTKDIDVSCHMRVMPGPPEHSPRGNLMGWLDDFCQKKGYRCSIGEISEATGYAKALNRSKITVNLVGPRDRNFRVLDAMGSKTCLLTSPFREVDGEDFSRGNHYVEYAGEIDGIVFNPDLEDLGGKIDHLLTTGGWKEIAESGYGEVHSKHTWAIRAKDLHGRLAKLL